MTSIITCVYCENTKLISNNICFFCNKIYNFNKTNIFDIVLCYSNYKQNDIITKTIEIYDNTKEIPLPNVIDKEVKLVKLNLLMFDNLIKKNTDEKIKNTFKDYKYFFTPQINQQLYNIKKANIFINHEKINYESYDNSIFNFPKYDIPSKHKKIYNDLINTYVCENNKISNDLQNEINKIFPYDFSTN